MFIFSKLLSASTQPMFWVALWWGMAMLWSGLLMLGGAAADDRDHGGRLGACLLLGARCRHAPRAA